MTDVEKPQPVDNSHLDAGIAARDAQKAEETHEVAEEAADIVEADEKANKDPKESAALGEETPGKPSPPKKNLSKRFGELTEERRLAQEAAEDAKRERDHWREQAMRLQQPKDNAPPAPADDSDREPQKGDEGIDYDDAVYMRRWYAWQRKQEKKQEAAQERLNKFSEKERAFRAEHPDYDALTRNPDLLITKTVFEAMQETDEPAAIAYYLAQNPHEAAEIAQMSPIQLGRAISRLEVKLSAPASEAPRQPEPKSVTRAPAPVTTLSGVPTIKKDYEEMSMSEYEEARRKEREAKGLPNR